MTFKELKELIELLKDSNLAEFNLKKEDFTLKIRTDKYTKSVNVAAPVASPAPVVSVTPSASEASATQASTGDSAPGGQENNEGAKASNLLEIKSPIVGTFYRSASPDKPAYIKVGDKVEQGSVVCIVEAMKLFNEIESEVSGTIVKVLIEDASPVEYDQPLFLVEA